MKKYFYLLILLVLQGCLGDTRVLFKDAATESAAVNTPSEKLVSSITTQTNMNVTGGVSSSGVTVSFTITNDGNADSKALVISLSDLVHFEFGANSCAGVILRPADTCRIEVKPKATENSQYNAELVITSVSSLTINMSGRSSGFPEPFVTRWKTDNTGVSTANQITLPLVYPHAYNILVDWGDGSQSTITSALDVAITHTYAVAGIYDVTIHGSMERIAFFGAGDKDKIIDILQWGTNTWATMEEAFKGCRNLAAISATDAPDLSNVTSLRGMFQGAILYNGGMNHWNLEHVVNVEQMLNGCAQFNQDLGDWDFSNVVNASYLFLGNVNFNQDISQWNTGNLINASGMFSAAKKFNQDIGGWDVSKVQDMSQMFYLAEDFNGNIENWNTSSLTVMNGMLSYTKKFNRPIGSWNTSNVTNMNAIFQSSSEFNQPLNWNTSNVTSMRQMFQSSEKFNEVLNFNTINVTDMTQMFDTAMVFNKPLNFNTSNVTSLFLMFRYASAFNQSLAFDTSQVTNMDYTFYHADSFNQDLSGWSTAANPTHDNFDLDTPAWVLAKPVF